VTALALTGVQPVEVVSPAGNALFLGSQFLAGIPLLFVLRHNLVHRFVKGTVDAVVASVTEFKVNDPGFHPDAFILRDSQTLYSGFSAVGCHGIPPVGFLVTKDSNNRARKEVLGYLIEI
jgi:hypothetical protein